MAIPNNVASTRRDLMGGAMDPGEGQPHGPGRGLSQRQLRLNHLWSHYTGNSYDARRVDWDGSEVLDHLEHEVVARAGFVPPGFFMAGKDLPLKFRKPTAPYYLVRVVVERFTGLLFSQKRHPKIAVPGDRDTEAWIAAFAKATRLWARFISARRLGGAMGSVAIGFKFVRGQPFVEVHDPRWCFVELDPDTGDVATFEKRYTYPHEERDVDGELVERWYWYRRVIDRETDTIWPRVPVDQGEPQWGQERRVQAIHGLGFVPVAWIKNTDNPDELDGIPDAHGIYDQVCAIDALQSQAYRGILANLDPTLKIKTDAEVPGEVRKGSDNAIVLGAGDDAGYLEITGTGIKLAHEQATRTREQALEVARCVLDTNFEGPARTEAEVKGNFSAMLEAADELREQWGEEGVRRLLVLVLRAARKLAKGAATKRADGATELVRSVVRLPGNPKLGSSEEIEIVWPDYFTPSAQDALTATQAATQAKDGGLIDQETATRHVAQYFGVEDAQEVAQKAKVESDAAEAAIQHAAEAAMGGGFGGEG